MVKVIRRFALFLVAFIGVVATTPIVIAAQTLHKLYRGENLAEYYITAAIGFDQAGGSVLYEQENFTISSYTYYLCQKGNIYACVFMRLIDFIFGAGHCKAAFEWETQKDCADAKRLRAEIGEIDECT